MNAIDFCIANKGRRLIDLWDEWVNEVTRTTAGLLVAVVDAAGLLTGETIYRRAMYHAGYEFAEIEASGWPVFGGLPFCAVGPTTAAKMRERDAARLEVLEKAWCV